MLALAHVGSRDRLRLVVSRESACPAGLAGEYLAVTAVGTYRQFEPGIPGRRMNSGMDLRLRVTTPVPAPEGITNPPIDELLDRTGSKYALVIVAAKRARQINAYYSQLGEGLLEYVGPMVETAPQEKALSIALREINSDLIEFKPSEA